LEETGLAATFNGIVLFRQAHSTRGGGGGERRSGSGEKSAKSTTSASSRVGGESARNSIQTEPKKKTATGASARANSDLFFVCQLTLNPTTAKKNEDDDGKNEDEDDNEATKDEEFTFQACPDEIAAIQWMLVQDYCAQDRWQTSPIYLELNRALLDHSKQVQQQEQLTRPSEDDRHGMDGNVWPATTLPLGFGRGTNTIYKSSRL